jgi:hypothetical protein
MPYTPSVIPPSLIAAGDIIYAGTSGVCALAPAGDATPWEGGVAGRQTAGQAWQLLIRWLRNRHADRVAK